MRATCVEHILNVHLGKLPIQTVTISDFKRIRSNPQNDYYFGVVVKMIANDYGDSPKETHKRLKDMFLIAKDGEKEPSTKDLSVEEFNEYIEYCCIHAAQDMGLYIPPPNEPLH